MKETNLRSKACAVAVAAGLGVVGIGVLSDGVSAADVTSVTDTIKVTVQPSCTFRSTEDKTYVGSAANGTEVDNFNDSGVHEFNLFCNNNNGYIVTATPYDLEMTGTGDVIAYTDNYTHTGVNSMWTAEIATETVGVTAVSPVPVGGGTVISSDSSTTAAGASFTATYKAYVGSETPAGTYTGTIIYTLTASGTSNNGGSSSGSGGTNQNDDNGNGSENSGTDSGNSSNSSNDAQNTTPTVFNNTYNTYNTHNTTNYANGNSTPVATGTQLAASGSTGSSTSANDAVASNSNSGSSSSYEKPLGVTTSAMTSNKDSGTDLMPILVAAGALAVAGVAVVALAKDKKEEEK